MLRIKTLVPTLAVMAALSACGGGSSGGSTANYATQLANLQAGDILVFTPEPDLPTGSATYEGVASFNLGGSSSIAGYYGALEVDVSFNAGTLTGQVTNLADFNQDAVSGRVDITGGSLTGTNSGIGNGLTASAGGTIDGNPVLMDVTGHFFGDNGEGIALYFDEIGSLGGGVGLAAR